MKVSNLFEKAELSETVSATAVNSNGCITDGACCVVIEHFMEIYINDKLALKLVCTPSNLPELVMGRLISEGYIESADDVDILHICESGRRVRVYLNESASTALELEQAVEEVPTCCTDNQVFLRNVRINDAERQSDTIQKLQKAEWKSEWIFRLANEFVSGSKIHKTTQGTHSCYLSVKGEILFASEDIGRHNALDKAIGYAVMQRFERKNCMLFTTGRVPTDMVKKVVTSRIPVLVSKSVCTDAAIEMARTCNLTLICRAWPDQYEIFNEAD